MAICMENPPGGDDPGELVKELIRRGKRFTILQVRAFGAVLSPSYEPPWWYWLDYFRANRN
jgi:hypothetical protein